MKFTKKMIMVPETEYLALINLLKKGATSSSLSNTYENEKSGLDYDIQKNLADHKTGSDLRMKRHSWLYKQRRQLKDLVENRPQKVVIENPTSVPPNIAPYMGIQNQTSKSKVNDGNDYKRVVKFEDQQKRYQKKIARYERQKNGMVAATAKFSLEDDSEEAPYSSAKADEFKTSDDDEIATHPSSSRRTSKSKVILNQDHKASGKLYPEMLNFIRKNLIRYAIDTQTGQILTNFNKPIAGSNYIDSLKFMTGQLDTKPKGHRFFLQRVNRDAEMLKFFPDLNQKHQQQTGEGKMKKSGWKKKIIALARLSSSTIKTPGLKRRDVNRQSTNPALPSSISQSVKFKPVLWARL